MNLFLYVAGNPVRWIDPWGLAQGDWWDPRTYVQITLSGSVFSKGFSRSTSGIEQETETYFNLVGMSLDIYIGKLPSPCDRVHEIGAGFRHLGIGHFYGRDSQFGGLVLHLGAGLSTPIYYSVTQPARGLPLQPPSRPTYLEKGR
jgi:hypothetical protein